MIASARMYAVSPRAGAAWRTFLETVIAQAGLRVTVIEHADPTPIEDLWERPGLAGVFMCGLPFALAEPRPMLLAAPVPSPAEFGGRPEYWSEWVVAREARARALEDTFGGRLALTVPHSQSGYVAPLAHLARFESASATASPSAPPLYRELIAPRFTPVGVLKAVVEGVADVAPVDAYAWRLLERFVPELTTRVRVIDRTPSSAIPALVASTGAAPGALAAPALAALRAALLGADRVQSLRQTMQDLLLERFVVPDLEGYEALRRDCERTLAHWRRRPLAAIVPGAFPELLAAPPDHR